jgi:hypothetical protein
MERPWLTYVRDFIDWSMMLISDVWFAVTRAAVIWSSWPSDVAFSTEIEPNLSILINMIFYVKRLRWAAW